MTPHHDESAVHWQVGEATLTTLSDGYFEIPLEHLIVNASMEKVLEVQSRALRSNPARVDVNAYLVLSPHHGPVLIDTGGGSQLMASMGRLPSCLKATDIRTQLPWLSVYLGHQGPESTYWYLSATPDLLRDAGALFDPEQMPEGGRR